MYQHKPDYVCSIPLGDLLKVKTGFLTLREWLESEALFHADRAWVSPVYEYSMGMRQTDTGDEFYGIHVAIYERGYTDDKKT